MQKGHSNVLLKLMLVLSIVIALLIPMFTITGLVQERQFRQSNTQQEIQQTWAGEQVLGGPMLRVPYLRQTLDDKGIPRTFREVLTILPESMQVQARVTPEVRRRGLFSAIVYTADVRVQGHFAPLDPSRHRIDDDALRWQDAQLVFAVSELRGIAASPQWTWLGEPVEAEADGPAESWLEQALVVNGPAAMPESGGDMTLNITLRGSRRLDVLPLGRQSDVEMDSPWSDPSFQGGFLPSASSVKADGFQAQWSVPHFARRFPQSWTSMEPPADLDMALHGASFGVVFLPALDFYQQVSRCTKYAVLFIGLTFGLFFLFEVLSGLRIHPVQYVMVGSAICVFYLLLLSVSEHLGFETAYVAGAVGTTALISAYSGSVLKARRRAWILATVLSVLYGTLYVLVQLETYALLLGSALLFGVLAAVMYCTRHLDWYDLRQGTPSATPTDLPPPLPATSV